MRLNSHPIVIDPLRGILTQDFIRTLWDRAARDVYGLFIAEGPRFLSSAADNGVPLAGLAVCRRHLSSPLVHGLIARANGVPILELTPEEFACVSLAADDGERREKVLGIFRQPWTDLPDSVRPHDLWLGLETIRSPGNLGTLLRSGDAAGAGGLIVLQDGPGFADPFDPGVVRASMGSVFAYRFIRTSHASCVDGRSATWSQSTARPARHLTTIAWLATGDRWF